jgi:hypothetical protein
MAALALVIRVHGGTRIEPYRAIERGIRAVLFVASVPVLFHYAAAVARAVFPKSETARRIASKKGVLVVGFQVQ